MGKGRKGRERGQEMENKSEAQNERKVKINVVECR